VSEPSTPRCCRSDGRQIPRLARIYPTCSHQRHHPTDAGLVYRSDRQPVGSSGDPPDQPEHVTVSRRPSRGSRSLTRLFDAARPASRSS
jgi:hypothetical protein